MTAPTRPVGIGVDMRRILICLCVTLWFSSVRADNLQNIAYASSLGDIKLKFPNAYFRNEKPAWLQPNQAFYLITGNGLAGAIRILFTDSRPQAKRRLADNASDPNFDSSGFLKRLAEESDDDALNVDWVRWSPVSPIPIERYKQKYGTPACSFDESMNPYCAWEKFSLTAAMSEDQKSVMFVTNYFTKIEQRMGWVAKFGFVPDYLK